MDRDVYKISSGTIGKVIILTDKVLKKHKGGSDEYFSSIVAESILNNTEILGFRVKIARIIDKQLINGEEYSVIEKLKGITMEEALEKALYPRDELLKIISRLFFKLLELGYLHLDFAPRNLLFSYDDKEIGLIDYERGLVNVSKINQDELKFLFSFGIFEELSAFLSFDEITQYFLNPLQIEINNIRIAKINEYLMRILGNRRCLILERFGPMNPFEKILKLMEINLIMAEILRGNIGFGSERINFFENLQIENLINIIYDKMNHE